MNVGAFVLPAYGRRSLGDVVPAVAAALGAPDPERPTGLVLPDAPSYVVFLVDGLGAALLEQHAHAAPYLSGLLASQEPGTAGVPSTTATSLTSLGTGLVPGVHGLVGFTSRIPGTDRLLQALAWDRAVDPAAWQPHETAWARLERRGVAVTVISKPEFEHSGLTTAANRGAEYVGASGVAERVAVTAASAYDAPSLTYVYDSDLDATGHQHGVASTEWLTALAVIDDEAQRLREALPRSTRLVVVADHGMVDCPATSRVDVDDRLELRDGLVLLGGEARFRHLYCADGAVDDVLATWREVLGERAEVLTREDAVGRGWFGEVSPTVLPRLGDVLVAGRGDLGVFSSRDFGYETTLVGLHGSLTPAEMLIPVLVD